MLKNFQQNGMAERCNRTLMDIVKSMISNSSLYLNLWGEILKIAMYILNQIPCKAISKTSFKLLMDKKSSLAYLYVWDYPVKAQLYNP